MSDEKKCYFDEDRNTWIHRFASGQIVCKCGEKVIRSPKRRRRMKFGRELKEDNDSA